jgi:hypothetical protein
MADVQYLVTTLVSPLVECPRMIYDFLGIAYSQRNPIFHGNSGFGDGFHKRLRRFYGEAKHLELFIEDFIALVRQCLRMSVIIGNLNHNHWKSNLIDMLLQNLDNRKLDEYENWTKFGLPSFF